MTPQDLSPVIISRNGRPKIRIAVPYAAPPPIEYAAEELRRHLYEMAGAGPFLYNCQTSSRHDTPTCIYVNDHELAKVAGIDVSGLNLAPESFHIESRQGSLYLLGGDSRGVLYGVYHLLEMLGCRWFTPEISRIPRRRSIKLPPLCVTQAPAFEFRDMFAWEDHDPIWWARNRMNGWYTPVPDYMGGHMTYGLFVHTFNRLVPPDEFFERHPEYFSLVGGVRRREYTQLCLTNPEVLRIVTERMLELMSKNSKATLFSVSQNDWQGYCECPDCSALAEAEGFQSGPILHFVNRLAEATSRVHPEKLIDTLAYQYSLDAPHHVVPHQNVRIRLCSICCCQGHGYGTCDHKESARFLQALNNWSRHTRQLYIWHYCTNFAHYPLPMPDLDEIHANLNLYRQQGVYGVFMQGMGAEGGGAEMMALRGYVISKLLWNPNQPVWPLVDEFLKAYYGAASPQMRQYLDIFHNAVREDRSLHPSLYDQPSKPLFNEDRLAEADKALTQGEAVVKGSSRLKVRLLRHGLTYARLLRKKVEFQRDGDCYHGKASEQDLQAFNDMVQDWRKAGIQSLEESIPIDFTLAKFRNQLLSHKVEWLRDGEQSIAVVPTLGGRLLEWHVCGRQWLAPPMPENRWLPMCEGYQESVSFGTAELAHSIGWAEHYKCRRHNDTSLFLDSRLGENIRLSRHFTLSKGILKITTRLINCGEAPLRCSWSAGLHLNMPGDDVRVYFSSSQGTVDHKWSAMSDGYMSALKFSGNALPTKEWTAEVPGFRLVHRFDDSIRQALLFKVQAHAMLALDVSTARLELKTGEEFNIRQEVEIRKSSSSCFTQKLETGGNEKI